MSVWLRNRMGPRMGRKEVEHKGRNVLVPPGRILVDTKPSVSNPGAIYVQTVLPEEMAALFAGYLPVSGTAPLSSADFNRLLNYVNTHQFLVVEKRPDGSEYSKVETIRGWRPILLDMRAEGLI